MSQKSNGALILAALALLIWGQSASLVEANQGCPFDDGSCQEYCQQQGCNMGYCGHFAWIQCICRKCGDEWSWYDKVRYNPDKQVNQTELDSLKLNGTSPLILTNGNGNANGNGNGNGNGNSNQTTTAKQQAKLESKPATLTTLLIPDLSETNGKLDLNDIPDENSDKFLDYLAKNHEKLVQATSANRRQQAGEQASQPSQEDQEEEQLQSDESVASPNSSKPAATTTTQAPTGSADEDTIEIQISSSNNNNNNSDTSVQPSSTQTTGSAPITGSPTTRLLRMAVVEARVSDEDLE